MRTNTFNNGENTRPVLVYIKIKERTTNTEGHVEYTSMWA